MESETSKTTRTTATITNRWTTRTQETTHYYV